MYSLCTLSQYESRAQRKASLMIDDLGAVNCISRILELITKTFERRRHLSRRNKTVIVGLGSRGSKRENTYPTPEVGVTAELSRMKAVSDGYLNTGRWGLEKTLVLYFIYWYVDPEHIICLEISWQRWTFLSLIVQLSYLCQYIAIPKARLLGMKLDRRCPDLFTL
jgi:hypothetical protein